MPMKKHFILIRGLAFLCVVMCAVSCNHKGNEEKKPATYKTMRVEQSTRSLESEYTAQLSGKQMVEVRPQVEGLIERICIDEGDMVRKGQTLFVINQTPYRAALAQAEASLKSAEAHLATARMTAESKRKLFEQNVVSAFDKQNAENALAESQTAVSMARAQLSNARNSLSYTLVKSPVDGVTGMIPYRVGALVGSNISNPLVTVSDDAVMHAYFSISEAQMLNLMEEYGSLQAFVNQMPAVSLRMSNGKMYGEVGKIDAVSGIVDESTGAVSLRASFKNAQHVLRNGGAGTVILPIVKENCIVIPQEATYELQDKVFVWKVVDGKAQSAEVKVYRLNNGKEYVVESGLQVGEEIISEGAGLVKEGAEVKGK